MAKKFVVVHTMLSTLKPGVSEGIEPSDYFSKGDVAEGKDFGDAAILKRYLDLGAIEPYYGPQDNESLVVEDSAPVAVDEAPAVTEDKSVKGSK